MNERAHLAFRLARGIGQRAHELGGRDPIERHATSIDALESFERARRETGCVAVNFGHRGGYAEPRSTCSLARKAKRRSAAHSLSLGQSRQPASAAWHWQLPP